MGNESDFTSRPVRIPKLLPEGWRFQELLKCCTPQQWPTLAKSQMSEDGFPVYGANGPIGYYREYTHENEIVVIGCRGTCGTIQIIPPKSYVNGNAMCLDDVRSDIVLQSYLYYSLVYRNVSDAVSGSAQPQITRQSLKRVAFPLPPLDDQAAIARILDAVDAAIARTSEAVERANKLRLGLMQAAFSFEFTDEPMKDTDAGRVPLSWDMVKGKKAFVLLSGGNASVNDLKMPKLGEDADAWFMKVDDFNRRLNRRAIVQTKIGFRVADNPKFSLLPIGTVVIAKRGAAILKNRVRTTTVPVALDPNLMGIQMLPGMRPDFFKYQLEWRNLPRYLEDSGIPQLNNKDLYPRYFLKAPDDQQEKIVKLISAAEAHEDALIAKVEAYEQLKRSLMHDLLTGKVRVNNFNFAPLENSYERSKSC
jgi:type I restriction enzyme, S subunit